MTQMWLTRFDKALNIRRLRYGLITGIVLWLTWLLSLILGPGNFDLANQVIGTDYLQFYTAGMTIRQGDMDKLYDFQYQASLEYDIAGEGLVNYHAFITPPFFAYLFVPLTYINYPISFLIWSILQIISLYASIAWLRINQINKAFLWSLTFFPIFASISFGQNSLLSMLLFSLSYTLSRKKYPFFAGVMCSLLLYKPQLIIGIGLIWLFEWRRYWKALFGVMAGAFFLIITSFLTLPDASKDYINLSLNSFTSLLSWEQFPIWHAHTWRSFWYMLLPSHLTMADVLWLIFSLCGLIMLWLFWRHHRQNDALIFAAAICFTIWVSPHAMIYDWAILLIPAFLLWDKQDSLRGIFKPLFALIWISTLMSGPLSYFQLLFLPFAIQISLPMFAWALVVVRKALNATHTPLQPFERL
jgi:hypothetical protein